MEKFKGHVEVSGITQKGFSRQNNEDNFQIGPYYKKSSSDDTAQYTYSTESGARYIILSAIDGMGGGSLGEIAALYTAEEFFSSYMKSKDHLTEEEEVSTLMRTSYQSANNRIVRNPSSILGAAGVSCIIDCQQSAARFFWSGDSRGYLYRNQKLLQITKDQTVAAICLKNGYYTKTDPQYQYDRRKLTGYIGKDLYCYDFTPLETPWIPLKNNDMIFLLTDGIYESCDEMDLEKAVNIKSTTMNSCKSLINVAVQNGASDDLTAVGSAFYTFD